MKKFLFGFIFGGFIALFGSIVGSLVGLAWLTDKSPSTAALIKKTLTSFTEGLTNTLIYGLDEVGRPPHIPYQTPRSYGPDPRHPSTKPATHN